MNLRNRGIEAEFVYKATCSSGKGGQHVNKVATRVELFFNVVNSEYLSEEEKEKIISQIGRRISAEGVLRLYCQSERTQAANKKRVRERFYELLEYILIPDKERIPTKITYSAVNKRLRSKKKKSDKKLLRRKLDDTSGD